MAAVPFAIDPEFAELGVALSPEERSLLEAGIESDGCLDSLKVWQEGGILIDGHNRFEICTAIGKPYEVTQLSFPSREAAYDWACDFQLGRRNLSEERKSYLRGKRYRNEKKKQNDGGKGKSRSGDHSEPHLEPPQKTSEKLAKEYGVSAPTIKRDAKFSEAVDQIAENVGKEAKDEILSGRSGLSRSDVAAVAERPANEQPAAIQKAKQGTLNVKPKPVEPEDEGSDSDKCWEIIAQIHKLTKNASLVAPYSELRRLFAELREAYREQHRSSKKGTK